MNKIINKKAILIASLSLLLVASIGVTLAIIFTQTNSVENTFNPSKVACAVVEDIVYQDTTAETDVTNESGPVDKVKTKQNVRIKNTGDTDAYIRVAVVVNWMSADGTRVWAIAPVENTNYEIDWAFDDATDPTDWVEGDDGYYYYKNPVTAGDLTEYLINSANLIGTAPSGYYLSIEIVASAIQATPTSTVHEQWGVTVASDGTISK